MVKAAIGSILMFIISTTAFAHEGFFRSHETTSEKATAVTCMFALAWTPGNARATLSWPFMATTRSCYDDELHAGIAYLRAAPKDRAVEPYPVCMVFFNWPEGAPNLVESSIATIMSNPWGAPTNAISIDQCRAEAAAAVKSTMDSYALLPNPPWPGP